MYGLDKHGNSCVSAALSVQVLLYESLTTGVLSCEPATEGLLIIQVTLAISFCNDLYRSMSKVLAFLYSDAQAITADIEH